MNDCLEAEHIHLVKNNCFWKAETTDLLAARNFCSVGPELKLLLKVLWGNSPFLSLLCRL